MTPTRRRIVRRSALAAALGLATTIAIAWMLAATADPYNGVIDSANFGLPDGAWWLMRAERPGLVVVRSERRSTAGRISGVTPGLRQPPDTDQDAADKLQIARAHTAPWTDLIAEADHPTHGSDRFRWFDARGWPWLALRTEYRTDALGNGVGARAGISLGWLLKPWRTPSFTAARTLPLCPMWPGLPADAALFGTAWWLLLVPLPELRRAHRRRRGRCVPCGYELAGIAPGQPCPECGCVQTV